MDEKLSILGLNENQFEKFIECPICDHSVGSLNPICQNCGLEMSSEGIIEFAECEEIELEIDKAKTTEIASFRSFAVIFSGSSLFLMFWIFLTEIKPVPLFIFWISIFAFIVGFSVTSFQLSRKNLTLEEKLKIKKEKIISLSIFFFSILIMLGIYIFLLK